MQACQPELRCAMGGTAAVVEAVAVRTRPICSPASPMATGMGAAERRPLLSPRVWQTSTAAAAMAERARPDGVRPLPVAGARAVSLLKDGEGELVRPRRSRAATSVKSVRPAALLPPVADADDGATLATAATAAADEAFGLKLRRKDPEEATRPRQARENSRYGGCEVEDPSGVPDRLPYVSVSPALTPHPLAPWLTR